MRWVSFIFICILFEIVFISFTILIIFAEIKKAFMDTLIIANKTFHSRLFLGTGKFSSNEIMQKAISASETEMVTAALKRVNADNSRRR